MDSKKKGIIVVAVVIVLIVAVFAAQALNDKNDKEETNAYYFYLDGMDSNNGWYSADATNIEDAFLEAMKSTKLTVELDGGMIVIDEYPESYKDGAGVGLGVFGYTSKDVSQPSSYYFAAGPVISDLNTNITYISYGKYSFDANYNTNYEVNPTVSTAWTTSGPFAAGAEYTPLEYKNYSFYLDGFGDYNGWYTASADDAQQAFTEAVGDSGLKVSFSDKGWITIDGYNEKGKGILIYTYLSTDLSQPNGGYFATGPVMADATGEIFYVVYSAYNWDATAGTLTYDITPSTSTGWMTTGPFAA